MSQTGESVPAADAARIPLRDRAVVTVCIALVTVLAWAYLVHLASAMSLSRASMTAMPGMGMRWDIVDAALTFVMWSVMMVGMMAPSATPMLLLFARASARQSRSGGPRAVPVFALGYLATWVAFSAAATMVQWALHSHGLLSARMALASPRVGGVLLLAAGAYQLTAAKAACLEHCQSPTGFLIRHWRGGTGGAFRMGVHHGVYCLGCCWALMAVLFAVGVMNLAWVGALTAFVLLERTGRGGALVARVGGVVLVALGVYALVA